MLMALGALEWRVAADFFALPCSEEAEVGGGRE